jgi:hypothetical protein
MHRNRAIVMTLIGFCGMLACTATNTRAQEFPGLGVGDMWAANMAFDQQFDQWNRHMSWQVALATPNDQPLPFNAMTISNSITAGSEAALGYVRNSQVNSNRQLDAVGRWTTGAVQGNWYYGSQYGPSYDPNVYVMPYTSGPGVYHNVNGYMYQGYNPGYENYYPVQYGR